MVHSGMARIVALLEPGPGTGSGCANPWPTRTEVDAVRR
jgi:hypothetical protein